MPQSDLKALLSVAHHAVDAAVDYVLSQPVTGIRSKGGREIVTDIDEAVEHLVRDRLLRDTPDLGFLGEETGATGDSATYWVLDPVDGTTNFSHGLPLNAVALGLIHDEQPVLGVIALPFLGRRYWAARGHGAYRDHTQITVSETTDISRALVALSSYGGWADFPVRDLLSAELDRVLSARAQGVRRLGATAVDLVFVAEGALDVRVTLGNRPWDTAAGTVIAREAGAVVVDSDGSPHTLRSKCTVAVTPGLRDAVLPLLAVARHTPYWPAAAD